MFMLFLKGTWALLVTLTCFAETFICVKLLFWINIVQCYISSLIRGSCAGDINGIIYRSPLVVDVLSCDLYEMIVYSHVIITRWYRRVRRNRELWKRLEWVGKSYWTHKIQRLFGNIFCTIYQNLLHTLGSRTWYLSSILFVR
jgi:hypothetical protein